MVKYWNISNFTFKIYDINYLVSTYLIYMIVNYFHLLLLIIPLTERYCNTSYHLSICKIIFMELWLIFSWSSYIKRLLKFLFNVGISIIDFNISKNLTKISFRLFHIHSCSTLNFHFTNNWIDKLKEKLYYQPPIWMFNDYPYIKLLFLIYFIKYQCFHVIQCFDINILSNLPLPCFSEI